MSSHILNSDRCIVKVNVEYPALPSSSAAENHVGFIPALKGRGFLLEIT